MYCAQLARADRALIRWVVLACACLLGCSPDVPKAAPASSTIPSAASASGVVARDTLNASPEQTTDTVACDFVPVLAHPSAQALLDDYLAHDAAGEFVEQSAWFDGAQLCPGHVPGWDESVLIRGYEVHAVVQDSTRFTAKVVYDRLGFITQNSASSILFEPQPARDTVMFELVRTKSGWRIVGPQLQPRVKVAAALNVFQFNESSRKALLDLTP
jgi:hypothetical protein